MYFISQSFFFLHLQEKQAGFYDNIIKVIRGEPEYFKAAFYGLGFPTFLRVSIKKKKWLSPSRLSCFSFEIFTREARRRCAWGAITCLSPATDPQSRTNDKRRLGTSQWTVKSYLNANIENQVAVTYLLFIYLFIHIFIYLIFPRFALSIS